jgi:polyphosphate glucokinase
MNVLVIDVGGTNVKMLATGQTRRRKFSSGPGLTPERMVKEVKAVTKDWDYEVVSIGYPGPVAAGRPAVEPRNLAKGWIEFDFARAFGRPVRIINDAAMQALGSYKGGKLLFLGLGTGLGSAAVVNGKVRAFELGSLPYKRGTYEDYVNRQRLQRRGRKRWSKDVAEVVGHMIRALRPDDVVLGGGNAKKLTQLPKGCRLGSNANAFTGGFRMWEQPEKKKASDRNRSPLQQNKRSRPEGKEPAREIPSSITARRVKPRLAA